MMAAVKNIVQAIPLTSITSASVTGSYAAINSTGLPNACFMIEIINNSTMDVTVSYDGTNDHEFVPTLTTTKLEFQTNSQPGNYLANLALGTKVYVKGTAGTGSVFLAGYFQPTLL
jgi:hypothetical protein